jgi:hypothetical protein
VFLKGQTVTKIALNCPGPDCLGTGLFKGLIGPGPTCLEAHFILGRIVPGRIVWGPIVQGLDRTYNCEDDTRSLATALFASSILVHIIPFFLYWAGHGKQAY